MARLNRFAEECAQRDIRLFYFYPAIPQSVFPGVSDELGRLQARFAADLRIPSLDTPGEMVYPDTDFFDTTYHLTADAGLRSTQLLAARLKNQLERPAGSRRQ